MLNRRYFLSTAAAALASWVIPFSSMAKPLSEDTTETDSVNGLKAKCTVYRDGQAIARLNLEEVITLDYAEPRLDQRILNFKADTVVHLPEADYELSHPVLGRFHVFLQTRGTLNVEQHDGRQYQACICDLREEYRAQYSPPIV